MLRPAAPARPYHHGDLPAALLDAALVILEQDGIGGLTLRALARRAGVSPMAPSHHFGDLTGVLSELAALGFRRFGADLGAAIEAAAASDRLDAMGEAYVAFATRQPALFQLMFRSERLDASRPALAQAMRQAGDMLSQAVGGPVASEGLPTLQQLARSVRAWSLVHGFAMLLIDGRLEPALAQLQGTDTARLLRAVLMVPDGGVEPEAG